MNSEMDGALIVGSSASGYLEMDLRRYQRGEQIEVFTPRRLRPMD